MASSFSSLPIIDLSVLSYQKPSQESLTALSQQLYNVFATTGFAYLVNAPISFTHDDVFGLARQFFALDLSEKMKLARRGFESSNKNTYRGYFPPQPGHANNLKEGFEIGSADVVHPAVVQPVEKFNLTEPNVWPRSCFRKGRLELERFHAELQSLSSIIVSLLAVSLGKPADYFAAYLEESLSTLRLLHYPPQPSSTVTDELQLCCTPHTDSGILTLLHQDATGGLEVLNANGEWISAPYVPESIVVNIGDLMARISGGRFVATMHRVRAPPSDRGSLGDGFGRLSVPFFFEPGEFCLVRAVDEGSGILYGEHVRGKMGAWVEFQGVPDVIAAKAPNESILPAGLPLAAF